MRSKKGVKIHEHASLESALVGLARYDQVIDSADVTEIIDTEDGKVTRMKIKAPSKGWVTLTPVSYTHLTLPTTPYV